MLAVRLSGLDILRTASGVNVDASVTVMPDPRRLAAFTCRKN